MITVDDRVYGTTEITEAVLVELIYSSPFQRLKTVSQMGIPDKYHCIPNFSRYDHSLGVAILLKRLGASLEEQVAGLLHDVSTPAFSHIADFVFGTGKTGVEDFHESLHEKFILETIIPEIVSEYGLQIDRIMNLKNYSLLDNDLPNLNADRVDYGLREMVQWQNPKAAMDSLPGFINHKSEIVFSDQAKAKIFATNFLQLQIHNWGQEESTRRYTVFSDMIKHLIEIGEVTLEDFYQEETFLMTKIENSNEPLVKKVLGDLLDPDFAKKYIPKGDRVFKKFRYVDPKILMGDALPRLSELDPEFNLLVERYRSENKQGILV